MNSVLPIQLRLFYANSHWHDQVCAVLGEDHIVGTSLALPLPGEPESCAELRWQDNTWQLINHSKHRLIFINEIAVATSQSHRVNIDDRIEIGNCRFLVEPRNPSQLGQILALANAAQTTPAQAPAWLPSDDQTTIEDIFDLIPQTPINPAFTPSKLSDADKQPQEVAQESGALIEPAPESAEMQRLQSAYFKALIDPNARLETHFSAAEIHDRFTPPDDDGSAIDIEELISGDIDIETLMHRINPMGSTPIVPVNEHSDVLMLFAGDAPTWQGQSLPNLARRDHHLMSLNSEYRLSGEQGSQPGTEQTSTQKTGKTS